MHASGLFSSTGGLKPASAAPAARFDSFFASSGGRAVTMGIRRRAAPPSPPTEVEADEGSPTQQQLSSSGGGSDGGQDREQLRRAVLTGANAVRNMEADLIALKARKDAAATDHRLQTEGLRNDISEMHRALSEQRSVSEDLLAASSDHRLQAEHWKSRSLKFENETADVQELLQTKVQQLSEARTSAGKLQEASSELTLLRGSVMQISQQAVAKDGLIGRLQDEVNSLKHALASQVPNKERPCAATTTPLNARHDCCLSILTDPSFCPKPPPPSHSLVCV